MHMNVGVGILASCSGDEGGGLVALRCTGTGLSWRVDFRRSSVSAGRPPNVLSYSRNLNPIRDWLVNDASLHKTTDNTNYHYIILV